MIVNVKLSRVGRFIVNTTKNGEQRMKLSGLAINTLIQENFNGCDKGAGNHAMMSFE